MNSSSQFNKNASTTIDGTTVSLQNLDVSLPTDRGPAEQAHNSMNLQLGKPTESFQSIPNHFGTSHSSMV